MSATVNGDRPAPPHDRAAGAPGAETAGDRRTELMLVETLPGLARVAAGMWLRGTVWTVGTGVRVSARIARAALSPEAAEELVHAWGGGLREYARELLGIHELDDRVRELALPLSGPAVRQLGEHGERPDAEEIRAHLRRQGAELLRESTELDTGDEVHPAFARVLAELAPDEARILRLLSERGPRPAVDVCSVNLIGTGTQLVERGLTMVGTEAGVRFADRLAGYLGNLVRLGLAEWSDRALDDHVAYQVIEAQPEVRAAMERAGRARTVHRTLRLTAFGEAFCAAVLPAPAAEPPAAAVDAPSTPEGSAGP